MYGATRFETASNLPKNSYSGWEFYELVELRPRDTLRFAVDTGTVRRQVQENGWYVWDETAAESRRPAAESKPAPAEKEPPSAATNPVVPEVLPPPVTTVTLPTEAEVSPAHRVAAATIPDVEVVRTPARKVSTPPPVEPPARRVAAAAAPEVEVVRTPVTKVSAPPPVEAPARRVTAPAAPEVATTRSVAPQPTRHQVVWFDIPVHDIDRAVRFYSAVLGTQLKKEQAGPGVAMATLPHAEGSIGGSLVQNMDAKPSESGPLLYLNTDNRLDDALNAVEKHGGKILWARHSIAPFGFRAIVLDSEGNRIALHSM